MKCVRCGKDCPFSVSSLMCPECIRQTRNLAPPTNIDSMRSQDFTRRVVHAKRSVNAPGFRQLQRDTFARLDQAEDLNEIFRPKRERSAENADEQNDPLDSKRQKTAPPQLKRAHSFPFSASTKPIREPLPDMPRNPFDDPVLMKGKKQPAWRSAPSPSTPTPTWVPPNVTPISALVMFIPFDAKKANVERVAQYGGKVGEFAQYADGWGANLGTKTQAVTSYDLNKGETSYFSRTFEPKKDDNYFKPGDFTPDLFDVIVWHNIKACIAKNGSGFVLAQDLAVQSYEQLEPWVPEIIFLSELPGTSTDDPLNKNKKIPARFPVDLHPGPGTSNLQPNRLHYKLLTTLTNAFTNGKVLAENEIAVYVLKQASEKTTFESHCVTRDVNVDGKKASEKWLCVTKQVGKARFTIAGVHLSAKFTSHKSKSKKEGQFLEVINHARNNGVDVLLGDLNMDSRGFLGGTFSFGQSFNQFPTGDGTEKWHATETLGNSSSNDQHSYMGGLIAHSERVATEAWTIRGESAQMLFRGMPKDGEYLFYSDHQAIVAKYVKEAATDGQEVTAPL